ncbi:YcaO-like family protein [Aestuariispira insulae]|uniref:Ribosomal protein S12 methylthiotransferase accessory factor n=1 Tax=Aestuariispira insulae TaxID=1461337 RepID=A0A3D9H1I2_9PROT|nr:YcaO-like family protein [Aestuariispira insulae]RED43369.1 ribosomal protein S12 methylthiotransferase accessory factor [Aestuariispira insulae]
MTVSVDVEGPKTGPSTNSVTGDVSVPKGCLTGTHRAVDPAETLRKITPHLARMGITRVANITGLDRVGIPVVAVYRPNARSVAVSQGKGFDLVAAQVSGLMEAIESYHAEHVKLPLRLASHTELCADAPVLDVSRLPRLSVSGFHGQKQMLWCEAVDLMADHPIWIPYEMVHTNYTRPLPTGSGNFQMSSNGLASGNHRLEAISHGICEVVERDAMSLWNLAGGTGNPVGRVDPASVIDPLCRHVLDHLLAAEISVGIWDVTSDVGIASFACAIVDTKPNHIGQFYSSHGSGTHPCAEIALLRALTEAAQTRLTYIAGARDDANRELFETARNPDRIAEVQRHLDNVDPAGFKAFGETGSYLSESLEEDLAYELECLKSVGIEEVAAVSLGGEDLGISVMRVIIPGLEGLHDAPGYIPGERARIRMEDMRQ